MFGTVDVNYKFLSNRDDDRKEIVVKSMKMNFALMSDDFPFKQNSTFDTSKRLRIHLPEVEMKKATMDKPFGLSDFDFFNVGFLPVIRSTGRSDVVAAGGDLLGCVC